MTTSSRDNKPSEHRYSPNGEQPLIQDRLVVPARASAELRRERLLALLEIRDDKPITLVSAPAGSGKTSLLSAWSANQQTHRSGGGVGVAWVTCDPRESDPRSFWSYVCSALEGCTAADDGGRFDPAGSDVGTAMRTLESFELPVALVLDDVHTISNRDTRDQLGYLIEALPTGCHLVLSTRVDPTLALFRARAAGRVQEIRVSDLSFTRREVEELVRISGIDLPAADASLLWECTEGWAAGVKLAIMSMRHAADPVTVVNGLVANPESAISGYLMEQALTHLQPDIRSFLLKTSIVERLDPELAELLTGRSDSGQVLRSLLDEPGFVFRTGTDGLHFRYHSLFRALLKSELHLADRQHMLTLHLRVARWAHSNGDWELAVEHALAARDFDLAINSILSLAIAKVHNGQLETIRRFLPEFPPEVTRSDPRLQVIRAALDVLGADPTHVIRRISAVRPALTVWPGNPGVRIRAVADLTEAGAYHQLGKDEDALLIGDAYRLNTELEPADPDPGWDVTLRVIGAAIEASALFWAGRLDEAERSADLAAELADEAGMALFSGFAQEIVALCQVERGDLHGADCTIRFAAAQATPTPATGVLQFTLRALALTWVETERYRLEQADRALRMAEEVPRTHAEGRAAPVIAIARVRLKLVTGSDGQSALDSLDEIQRRYDNLDDNWLASRALGSTRVEAMMQLGRFQDALTLARQFTPEAAGSGKASPLRRAILASRILINFNEAGRPESELAGLDLCSLEDEVTESVAMLQRSDSGAERQQGAQVRLLLGAAVLEQQRNQENRGSWLLSHVLEKVDEQGWRMPFYELGHPAIVLLEQERMRISQHGGLVTELLAELRTNFTLRRTFIVAPLSEREMEILQFLPTVLSQAELCSTLYISKNTLKSHLRAIYRKLNVENRREAVLQAQQLQLL